MNKPRGAWKTLSDSDFFGRQSEWSHLRCDPVLASETFSENLRCLLNEVRMFFEINPDCEWRKPRLGVPRRTPQKMFLACFWFARDRFFLFDGQDIFSVFCPQGLGQASEKQKQYLSRPFSISSVHLWLRRPSSAFASDISARATRAYLSWCGLAFSERLKWKEMSRSGKAPATIWGEEGILSPASGSSSWWLIWVLLL